MENLHEHFHSQPPKAPEHAHPQLAGPLFYEGLRWLVWTWPGSLQGLRRPVAELGESASSCLAAKMNKGTHQWCCPAASKTSQVQTPTIGQQRNYLI